MSATWALSSATVRAWSAERFDGDVSGVVVPDVTDPAVVGVVGVVGVADGRASSSRVRRTTRATDPATTMTARAMASATGAGRGDRSGKRCLQERCPNGNADRWWFGSRGRGGGED